MVVVGADIVVVGHFNDVHPLVAEAVVTVVVAETVVTVVLVPTLPKEAAFGA